MKTDSNGNVEWNNTFAESIQEFRTSAKQTSDGGYIIAGPIKKIIKTETGWHFKVSLVENNETLEFDVDLDKQYYKQLTSKEILPEELIKKSFRFLLEREGKEAILYSFNLKVIQKYFPDFEAEII